jgi:hypothetical protein
VICSSWGELLAQLMHSVLQGQHATRELSDRQALTHDSSVLAAGLFADTTRPCIAAAGKLLPGFLWQAGNLVCIITACLHMNDGGGFEINSLDILSGSCPDFRFAEEDHGSSDLTSSGTIQLTEHMMNLPFQSETTAARFLYLPLQHCQAEQDIAVQIQNLLKSPNSIKSRTAIPACTARANFGRKSVKLPD